MFIMAKNVARAFARTFDFEIWFTISPCGLLWFISLNVLIYALSARIESFYRIGFRSVICCDGYSAK
jgi:hypothetical protein